MGEAEIWISYQEYLLLRIDEYCFALDSISKE